MIGLALGNLFAGPISDATGRKKPLWISMFIYTLASLGIVFVTNIEVMIALRFIQGVTGGQLPLFQELLPVICIKVRS